MFSEKSYTVVAKTFTISFDASGLSSRLYYINVPRSIFSSTGIIMSGPDLNKQWWKVCFVHGDQTKFYRQLYGKRPMALTEEEETTMKAAIYSDNTNNIYSAATTQSGGQQRSESSSNR